MAIKYLFKQTIFRATLAIGIFFAIFMSSCGGPTSGSAATEDRPEVPRGAPTVPSESPPISISPPVGINPVKPPPVSSSPPANKPPQGQVQNFGAPPTTPSISPPVSIGRKVTQISPPPSPQITSPSSAPALSQVSTQTSLPPPSPQVTTTSTLPPPPPPSKPSIEVTPKQVLPPPPLAPTSTPLSGLTTQMLPPPPTSLSQASTVVALMTPVNELAKELVAFKKFNFGLDKPMLEHDVNRRADAVLSFYIGLKKLPGSSNFKLVLIGPSLKPTEMSSSTVREWLFEDSDDPTFSVIRKAPGLLADAVVEKSDQFVEDKSLMSFYQKYLYSKIGAAREIVIYDPADQIPLQIDNLTSELRQKKTEWEQAIDDYRILLDQTLARINEQDVRVDLNHFKNLDITVKDLQSALLGLASPDTSTNKYSIYAIIHNLFLDEDFASLSMDDKDEIILSLHIVDLLVKEITLIQSHCEKKSEEKWQQSLNETVREISSNWASFSELYSESCVDPIKKIANGVLAGRRTRLLALQKLGIDYQASYDIFAARARSVYDKLLSQIPTPSELRPTHLPRLLPPVPIAKTPPPPPGGLLAKPKSTTTKSIVLRVSPLQSPINSLADNAGFIASKKIPFAFDARTLDPSIVMDDQARTLSFVVGIVGSGVNNDSKPFKLYLVGPHLLDTNGNPLNIKENYRLFIDGGELIYPVDLIANIKKEPISKTLIHDGKQLSLTSVTILPAPAITELYDQAGAVESVFDDLINTLTQKYQSQKPQKSPQNLLQDQLNLMRRDIQGLDDEIDNSWD